MKDIKTPQPYGKRNRPSVMSLRRLQIECLENRFAMAGDLFHGLPSLKDIPLDVSQSDPPPIVIEPMSESFDAVEQAESVRTVWELDLNIDDLWEPHVDEMHQHAWVDHPMEERQGFFIQPNWNNGLALQVRPEVEGTGTLTHGWYVEVPTQMLWQQWSRMNMEGNETMLPNGPLDSLDDSLVWKLRVEYASSSDPVWAKLWLEPDLSSTTEILQLENPSAIYFGEIYTAPLTETQPNLEGDPKTAEDMATANVNDWIPLRPRGLNIIHHSNGTTEANAEAAGVVQVSPEGFAGQTYFRNHSAELKWSTRDDANDFNPQEFLALNELLVGEVRDAQPEVTVSEPLHDVDGNSIHVSHVEASSAVKLIKAKSIPNAEESITTVEAVNLIDQAVGDWTPQVLARLAELPWLMNAINWFPSSTTQYLQALPQRMQQFSCEQWKQISTTQLVACSTGIYLASHFVQRRLAKLKSVSVAPLSQR